MSAPDLSASTGGELGALVARHDWARTPLGPMGQWPQALRIVLSILLGSRYAMWLGWGPDLTFFYNDAYRHMTLGAKHPWALGRPAREVWPEIWSDLASRVESVVRTGAATWDEGLRLFLERSGFREETYHTFSYSPVPSEQGGVAGLLCVVTEDTARIIGERRLRTLRELATDIAATNTLQELERAVELRLAQNPYDLPFTLIYLLDADGRTATLAAASGLERGHDAAPPKLSLDDDSKWPLRSVVAAHDLVAVDDLPRRFPKLPSGAWQEPAQRAALAPIAQQGQGRLAGFLVAGLNPYRPFDASYRGFVELVAGQLAAGIANSRAYEEERRRAEALAEIDRAKTAFFSNVSHEFRTPLTLMLGPLEELGERSTLGERERAELALVLRNGQRLLRLVNTLLDFSRIEAGRVQARFEPTALGSFTADIASVFRSAIERAGMRLVTKCEALAEPVYVDREMWEKIVLNLVSNAFKYTLEGEIEVTLATHGDGVELSVRDTGTGIPASELPKIWSRFHRVEGAHGRTHEGSGIGLALVHELVKLHGGSVGVESEPGRGSTFRVFLARGKEHLPAERVALDGAPRHPTQATAFVREALRWLPADANEPLEDLGSTAPVPDPGATERQRILVADDNADMRGYVRRLLADRYDVVTVADGRAAFETARAERPDLVLSDVMMPHVDGFGLLRALREDAHTATIPVIMLSARAGEEARVEGLVAGADDYLIKPFSARELLARVGGTLALSKLRRDALRREEELRAETTNVLESITEGFIALDRDFRLSYVNAEAERINGISRHDVLGRTLHEVFPLVAGTRFERELRRAFAERTALKFENFYGPLAKWFEIDVYPAKDGGLAVYFRDVTERKRHTEQLQAVAAAAVAVSGMVEVEQVLKTLIERTREILDATEAMAVLEGEGVSERRSIVRSAMTAAELDAPPTPEDVARLEPKLAVDATETQPGRLDAPLTDQHGRPIGVLRLGRKRHDDFSLADTAILRQLAQIASVAVVNARLYRAAEAARAEAVAANRMKDQFLATLSHELRTPLNAILGWSKILRRGPRDGHALQEGLDTIERNAKVQAQLIEDLLDLSRIISGKLRLDVQRVNLSDVIEAATAAIRPAADAKEIRLHSMLDALAGPVRGDPARLQQVVWNLLSNAVKFTPRGGRVEVVLERVNSHVEVCVSDTGAGIAPEFLPHVFERFRQADASTTRRHSGLGLGLSIVRELVEMHGGSVRAKSPGEGQGATFVLALPIAVADAPARSGNETGTRENEPPLAASVLEGVRVLVVDDEPDARRLIFHILGQAGASVVVAGTMQEALAALDRVVPDVLLTDIGMPEHDGYELIRSVRERGFDGRKLPAVALTAFARPEDRRRSLLAGFQMHVAKPVDPDELLAIVATLTGRTGGSSA